MARRHLDRSETRPLEQTREIKALRKDLEAFPADDSITFAKMQNIATDRLIGRDTAGSGNPEEISLATSLEFTGSGGIQRSALTGDVTASAGSNTTTIANDVVSNTKLANMAQDTIKGRVTASTGDPEDLTAAQARTVLGLGTSALKNTGTSGDAVPLLDAANTWSGAQSIAIATSTPLTLQTNEDGAAVGPAVKLYRNSTSPAAADVIGAFEFDGMDSAAAQVTYARWQGVITDPTAGTRDGEMQAATRVANAFATRMVIGGALYHPSATGGDTGNNSINFGAVRDDNVLLTDYVFDKWLGQREEYSQRVQAKYDELDPAMFSVDAHVAYMRANRRLYGMPDLDDCIDGIVKGPSLGGMIQLLWQALELSNIHIAELNERLRALEGER
jgi:hypothetical protein